MTFYQCLSYIKEVFSSRLEGRKEAGDILKLGQNLSDTDIARKYFIKYLKSPSNKHFQRRTDYMKNKNI